MQLTNEQRVFVVLNFNETQSCTQVRRRFQEKFPERNSPDKKTIYRTVEKFNEHGTILNRNKGNSGRRKTHRTQENIARVQLAVQENPNLSLRRNEIGLKTTTLHRILTQDLKYHPYKMQVKHELLEPDYARRMAFCNWISTQRPRFSETLVMTDEAAFSMGGIVNTQNTRRWSTDPPEGNVFEKSIRRDKISVWAGLCGNGTVIGPFFYDVNLTGDLYLEMLDELIIPAIQQAYGNNFRNVWFMQDGAPAHRRITVSQRLREVFGQRIMALGFPVEWPPRSPDLTPCDFFLWGHVKNQIYKRPPQSLEILRQQIEDEFDALTNDPEMIMRAVHSMMHRADTCVERNGGHVEGY